MKKIKVLNLFTIMHRAGAETLVMNYYRKIDRDRFQFDFVVHRSEKGDYDDEIRKLGGNIYIMSPIYPQNFKKYKKEISNFFDQHNDYDIIHSHCSELGYFFFEEAKRRGIKVLISHAHGLPFGINLKTPFRYYFKKRMKPLVTDFFVCGNAAGKWLFGNGEVENFQHMKNAIDTDIFKYDEISRNIIREKLGITNQLLIGHVGRFSDQKNHKFIIEILNEAKLAGLNCKCIFIGEGELENDIKTLVINSSLQEQVIFEGTVDNVQDYMSAMDIFILPSKNEGFGNVLLEAQSTGLRCITTKDKVPSIVKVTDLLKYLSIDDPKLWVSEISKSSNYERYSRKMDICKAGYDISENVKWLENYYETAVGR